MPTGFTVMWSREHYLALQKAGDSGKALQVLFGGTHQSAPSLKRAGIVSGDIVFPVAVSQGTLYVLAGVVVGTFTTLLDYTTHDLGLPRVELEGLIEFDLLEYIQQRCGVLGHREPYGCSIEVARAATSTPLRFDNAVPSEQLERITFCPRRGEPLGLKHVKEGKLTSPISLHGNVRRLCPETTALFAELAGLDQL